MSDILMKCGHSANAEQILDDDTRIPACAICSCIEIEETKPDLAGRQAVCTGHKGGGIKLASSKFTLPFF